MNVIVDPSKLAKTTAGMIDCDIHPVLRSPAGLEPYLPKQWQEHFRSFGFRLREPLGSRVYPTVTPALARKDSWPPAGGPPGSDLAFMREQHLTPLGIQHGVLQPLVPAGRDERNPDFSVAVCRAMNDWQVAEWTSQEPRLKASICTPFEDPEAAVREIDRCAEMRDFCQILMVPRLREPPGVRRYWPIFEAAARHGLPLGMHVGGSNGVAPSCSGWPSYYGENHLDHALALQAAAINMVFEGVFETFPTLKLVIVEGGFTWVPSTLWRMDKYWSRLRSEVPHLRRPPSEYVRENIWFATQPVDEPERREDIVEIMDWIGWDRIVFATDYPHWDADDPHYAFRVNLPEDKRQLVFGDNARRVYRFI